MPARLTDSISCSSDTVSEVVDLYSSGSNDVLPHRKGMFGNGSGELFGAYCHNAGFIFSMSNPIGLHY